MEIDFSQKLKNLKGDVLKEVSIDEETKKEESTDYTLGTAAVNTLFANEKDMTGEQKVKRYNLATKIFEMGKVDVTTDEIVLIKKVIGKFTTALIVGQAYKMLEKEEEKKEKQPAESKK